MMLQSVKMAWEAIISNKMRSFLTMLGIIIGVVSLVDGATGTITDEVAALGNDMLTVSIMDDKGAPVRLDDLSQFTALSEVEQVSPSGSMNATAKYQTTDTTVSVYGVTPGYYDIQGLQIEKGRFLKTADVENRSYVAVLSSDAAQDLFGDAANIIGKRFAIDGRSFEVVGVLAESESMISSMMGGTSIYVPYTVESRMAGQPYVTSFCISSTADTDSTEAAVNELLLNRFQQDEDAFSLMNMSSLSSTMDTITGTLSMLLGGIGIMNIMLVSVTERTREIGIRKAIGAGHRSIMAQFLIEALLVSLIGLLLSQGILMIASAIAGSITFSMSGSVVALAVGFSSAAGLLFGLYPANKVAKKHPIEALRYEG